MQILALYINTVPKSFPCTGEKSQKRECYIYTYSESYVTVPFAVNLIETWLRGQM